MRKYPAILIEEENLLKSKSNKLKEDIGKALKETQELLKKNPDAAHAKITEAQIEVMAFQEKLKTLINKLAAFDIARQSHEKTLGKTVETTQNVFAYLTDLVRKGYWVYPDKELTAAQDETKKAREILVRTDDVPDYHLVIRHAEEATRKAVAVQDAWEKHLNIQRENARYLKEMQQWYKESFPRLQNSGQNVLEQLKAKTPREVWEPTAKNILQAGRAEFEPLISTAERLNGMERQEFEMAAKTIEKIEFLKRETETSLMQPGKTLQGFIEAQGKVKTLAAQAASSISQAERAANGSDAEGAGRGKIKEAKNKVAEVGNLEKSDLPNWLLVVASLLAAITFAQVAEREAKDHASSVESARRQHEEAGRQAARRRREESDSYYSSRSSSGSFGSSGGSSFGGFGGGGFGGGGASGHW